jgi:hypothetical protein
MKFKIVPMNKFYKDIKFPTREIYGSYLSSDYSPIPGYNTRVFMIAFNLDYRLYSPIEYLDIENYARSCIDFLNKTPKTKRDKSPIMGNLMFHSAKVLTHFTGNKYIQVRALSDEKKNKVIFRIGDEVEQVPSLKERKEDKKRELEEAIESGDDYVKKVEKVLSAAPKKRGRPPKSEEQKALELKNKQNKVPGRRGRPPKNKK